MKKITYIILLLFACHFSYGQEIASFSSVANSGCTGTISNDANITTTGICRGSGIVENTGATYNSRNWTTNPTIDSNDYLQWTLTPNSGFQINLASMDLRYDRSLATGPTMVDIQIDTGSGFLSIFTDATVSDTSENNDGIDLSSITGVTGTITFRLYAFNAGGAGGTFDIEERIAANKGIIVNGVVSVIPCTSIVTWNGSLPWVGGSPDSTTTVELNADYDTATYGNFSACSLTVSNGATLNIADNNYIEAGNDLTVDAGSIITVQPYGAFIQNNDIGLLTNNGTILVVKDTAPLNNWYEYTYWSSPVSNATVGVALSDSDPDRRFVFDGSQFNDELTETGNNNTFIAGQDDIDDDSNDWQWVSGATTMQPGVGYATTHSEIAFVFPGVPYRYTFQGGVFNNGEISVAVDRNDATTADFNWNLIGNPYPSAIDANTFMTQNMYDATTNPTGTLDGALYFWSQNTDKASNANGDDAFNFATSDYATYNGISGTAGGDGLTPNGSIPSGQGFFVSFSDNAPSNSGTVVFNNAMRSLSLSPDNSQFFKNTNSKKKTTNNDNKLWVNLTSDNGVFNQISIGYVNSATSNDDGSYYDARKIVAPTAYAALYSTIENSDKKYVIQGKNTNSLNIDENIKLGFKTSIDVATLFKISIAQLQGDFLTGNTIYIKDNLLNKLHNLSTSDYTFTSETGEFNDRFEIVFNDNALSTNDVISDSKSLKIVELKDDNVQFTTSNTIKTIRIFDLLGRQLYEFKGQTNSETYKLSKISSTVYIAKVELSNGAIITKKAVKR